MGITDLWKQSDPNRTSPDHDDDVDDDACDGDDNDVDDDIPPPFKAAFMANAPPEILATPARETLKLVMAHPRPTQQSHV